MAQEYAIIKAIKTPGGYILKLDVQEKISNNVPQVSRLQRLIIQTGPMGGSLVGWGFDPRVY